MSEFKKRILDIDVYNNRTFPINFESNGKYFEIGVGEWDVVDDDFNDSAKNCFGDTDNLIYFSVYDNENYTVFELVPKDMLTEQYVDDIFNRMDIAKTVIINNMISYDGSMLLIHDDEMTPELISRIKNADIVKSIFPTVEEFIELLKKYPKDTLVKRHCYDAGDVYVSKPTMEYYEHQKTLYIF